VLAQTIDAAVAAACIYAYVYDISKHEIIMDVGVGRAAAECVRLVINQHPTALCDCSRSSSFFNHNSQSWGADAGFMP